MRISLGPVPLDDWNPGSGGWKRVREPSSSVACLILSFPAGLFVSWLTSAVIDCTVSSTFDIPSPTRLLALLVVLVAAHELLHALTHPDHGTTSATTIGFWPSRLVSFAHYDGIRSRANFLAGLIAPFLALTVLPVVCVAISPVSSPTLELLSLANAAGSGLDVLGFMIIFIGVPPGAEVRNLGWNTYWRLPAAGPTFSTAPGRREQPSLDGSRKAMGRSSVRLSPCVESPTS